jgi:hypothetical protein
MGKAFGRSRIAPTVVGATLAAITVALALSGCVSADPKVTPQPHASATPLFATDAEALTAAEEAYAAYLKVSDQIFIEGGSNPQRLSTVAVGQQLEINVSGFKDAARAGYRSTGGTKFDTATLQRYDETSQNGVGVVTIYLCEDIAAVDVVDRLGKSVVSTNRPDRAGYEVEFDKSKATSALIISSKTVRPELKC